MANNIPTNAYRVFTGLDGEKQLDYIMEDGTVLQLKPKPEDKKLADGYYDDAFKLIRLSVVPPEVLRAIKSGEAGNR